MAYIINQGFDLKSPQFNFTRDYYEDMATLLKESYDNFPDHFITNVGGVQYQLTKNNSVDTNTGKWRKLTSQGAATAENTSYNNTNSGTETDNVQDTIDDIYSKIGNINDVLENILGE